MKRLAIDVALTQLDVKEATGNNDGIPAQRYNRGDAVAWCASFCLYCNNHSDEVDIAPTVVEYYEQRAVQGFEDHCKILQWWLPSHSVPQRGDYIFFGDRGDSDAALKGRHMGLVDRVEQPGGLGALPILHTVEGNLGNKVAQVTHDLNKSAVRNRITGYARVPIKL